MEVKKVITPLDMANKADLVDGKVPAEELPSYVDDVVEYEDMAHFPLEGEAGKIYVAQDSGYTYRWSGSMYVQIGGSAEAYMPIPNTWDTNHTTMALCQSIVNDIDAGAGMVFLGKISCSDLPASLVQGEAVVEIISNDSANGKNIHIILTSANQSPYRWEYSYVKINGAYGSVGWIGYVTEAQLDTKVDKVSGKSLSTNDYTTGEKEKLAGIETGAQVNVVTSVAGKTGAVTLDSTDVGLGNVDNTSDLNKPISTTTQTALDNKVDKVSGKGLSTNDYTTSEKEKLAGIETGAQVNTIVSVAGKTGTVTLVKEDVGLGNVDNTADADKPISTATQTALDNKVDKVSGKGLSANDYTTAEKEKLAGIETGAQVNAVNSVAGKMGTVTLVKGDVGLGNVDNTSDLDKPVSTATQAALNLKQDVIEDATELEVRRLFRTEYTITGYVTDGTLSGDATIWTQETATTTVVPDTGHILPDSVTVTGATGVYDSATGGVALSAATGNVAITAVCPLPQLTVPNILLADDYLFINDVTDAENYDVYVDDVYATNVEKGAGPTPSLSKGDIISFDVLGDGSSKRFRVIDVDSGNTVKLLGLDDLGNSVYNASSKTVTFDNGSSYQDYEGSDLDTYLNTTYYNSLSSAVKSAIVDETLVQSCYSRATGQSSSAMFNIKTLDSDTIYAYTRTTQRTVGSRHIHAIELDEIKSYFNASTGDLIQGTAINELFFEQTTAISKYVWCASAYADNSRYAFFVLGDSGNLYNGNFNYNSGVRPAFKINLSTIKYTKEANA